MNKKQLIDSFVKNWPAKVICFVIAIFLYLFYQASLIDKKTFVIPLEIKEQGVVVHVGNVPTSVVVSVRASENDIKAIFASDMSASIDLNNITEPGNYLIPINLIISDKLMALDPLEVKLKVENLRVIVDKRVIRYVPVVPSVVGEVHEDYNIKEIIMSPSTVCLEGPDSLISSITEITTERVNVSNAITTFTTETGYNNISEFVDIKEKEPAKATVIVEPKVSEFEFKNIPYKAVNLKENLEIKSEIPLFSIKIKGQIIRYKKIDLKTIPINIDFSSVSEAGVYELPVICTVPYGFEILSRPLETITVEVVEKLEIKNDTVDSDNQTADVSDESI